MGVAKFHHVNFRGSPMTVVMGVVVELVMVLVPMGCAAVVLYDIGVNGLHSIFAMIGLFIIGLFSMIKLSFMVTGMVEEWIEDAILRGKRARGLY